MCYDKKYLDIFFGTISFKDPIRNINILYIFDVLWEKTLILYITA